MDMEKALFELKLLLSCLERKNFDMSYFEYGLWELPHRFMEKLPEHIKESIPDILEQKEYDFESMLECARNFIEDPSPIKYKFSKDKIDVLLSRSWLLLTMVVDIILFYESMKGRHKMEDGGYYDFFITTFLGVECLGNISKEDAYEIRDICNQRKCIVLKV